MQRLLKISSTPLAALLVAVTVSLVVRAADDAQSKSDPTASNSNEEQEVSPKAMNDAGMDVVADAGVSDSEESAQTQTPATKPTDDAEVSSDDAKGEGDETSKRPPISWRRDPSVKRRPGSYLGGGMAYTMAHSWYRVELREYEQDYKLGPLHGTGTYIRVGDAFFEWFAVGFHILLISANNMGQSGDKGMSGFALFLDPTFYPWKGLGLRPSVGLGFSYAQAGKGSHEFGFGGPATLAFALTYEFRVSRLFVMGPIAQICWTTGDDYDAMFFSFGIQMLKWFMTPEG